MNHHPDDTRAMRSEELLRASQAGSRQALDELLTRHLPSVRAFVRLRLGPDTRAYESASDIVQSVCADLLGKSAPLEYRGEAQFRSWLHVTALNKIRQKHRHHAALKRRPQGGPPRPLESGEALGCYAGAITPSHAAVGKEDVERLEEALDRLPDHYREVISLVRIVGLTPAEAGEAMGTTAAAARNLLNRALVKLATEMRRGGA